MNSIIVVTLSTHPLGWQMEVRTPQITRRSYHRTFDVAQATAAKYVDSVVQLRLDQASAEVKE